MERILPKDAARDLNLDPETVRVGLRTGRFEWGTAVKRSEDAKRWIYIIYPEAYSRLVKKQEEKS